MIRVHMVYARARVSGVPEDVAVTTHDFDDNGDPTSADLDTIQAAALLYWNTIKSNFAVYTKLAEIRIYYRDEAIDETFGEPRRSTTYDLPGTLAGVDAAPPQIALSVTERTASRPRWGRFYQPGLTAQAFTVDGMLDGDLITNVANAVDTWYSGLKSSGFDPVVLHRRAGLPDQLVVIEEIQVDDIADVIRRRRFQVPTTRLLRTI
jgi:hypothetical protein